MIYEKLSSIGMRTKGVLSMVYAYICAYYYVITQANAAEILDGKSSPYYGR